MLLLPVVFAFTLATVVTAQVAMYVKPLDGNPEPLPLPAKGQSHAHQGSNVLWTDEVDIMKFLPEGTQKGADGRPKVAYRDTFIENIANKAFRKYMAKVRNPQIYGRLPVRDPIHIRKGVHFNKKDKAFSLDMRTSQMSLHGLRDLKMDYVRVIRHVGLTDVKGLVRVRTETLKLKGQYEMNGEVLSFIPITGSGNFEITLKDCQFLAKGFSASSSDKSKAVVKNLDVQITYEDVEFSFENLLGGGSIGSTANKVINTFGVAFVEAQKDIILDEAKRLYHVTINDIL